MSPIESSNPGIFVKIYRRIFGLFEEVADEVARTVEATNGEGCHVKSVLKGCGFVDG